MFPDRQVQGTGTSKRNPPLIGRDHRNLISQLARLLRQRVDVQTRLSRFAGQLSQPLREGTLFLEGDALGFEEYHTPSSDFFTQTERQINALSNSDECAWDSGLTEDSDISNQIVTFLALQSQHLAQLDALLELCADRRGEVDT